MKKYLLITSFLILIPYTSVQGQETDSLSSHSDFNSFFDFRIGLAFQGSLNLESLWYKGSNAAILLNTGIGFTTISYEFATNTGVSFPATMSVLLGSLPYDQRSNHLEINAGLITLVNGSTINPLPRASIGYRHQNPQTDRIFRFYIGFIHIGVSFNL